MLIAAPRPVRQGIMMATMQTNTDWVATRVEAALKESPVAEAIASTIKNGLNGQLTERALRTSDLTDLAKRLTKIARIPPTNQVAVED